MEQEGTINHYIEQYESVSLRVLVNYLTIGNLSHLNGQLKDTDRNMIAKFYSIKYNKQYLPKTKIAITEIDIKSSLKFF